MTIIGEISTQKKRKNRFNLYDEAGEFILSVSDETLVRFKLKTGMTLSPELLAKIREEDNYQYAKNLAAGYLSYGPRTRRQMETYLQGKGLDEETIGRTMVLLEEYGYIDDLAYAREFVRQQGGKYGDKAILYKLAQRGISQETAQEACFELPQDSRQEAVQRMVEKLFKKYAGLDQQKKRQRIYAAMMRKGFAYEDFAHMLEGGYFDEEDG